MAAMSMTSLNFSIKDIVIAFLFLVIILLSPYNSSSLSHPKHDTLDSTTLGVLVGEKTRLGSMPPSCYNKCNQCHPCMAVQVPTLPSHNRVEPSRTRAISMDYNNIEDSPLPGTNRYSNYKPLGWKCRCNGHFYNP